MMTSEAVLSLFQTRPLLAARRAGQQAATISLDLGRTTTTVILELDGARLPSGLLLDWADVERIDKASTKCFLIEPDEARRQRAAVRDIQIFSARTNWLRSLMPTELAPTMLVSGLPMHRIKGIDPYHDTKRKVAALAPVRGDVLDTATGLGYTAIELAKTAARVVTIELDPASLEVARLNPWSADLFTHPAIEQIVGDTCEEVLAFGADTFSCILHDPPMFGLAGDLYAGALYREFYRILHQGGRLFHYIGALDSKSGQGVAKGVVRRLQQAGFSRITRCPAAFGVLAYK